MEYSLLVPPRIVFGWGRRREAGSLAASLGRRALVVSGSRTLEKRGVLDELTASLAAAGVSAVRLPSATGEPEVADVDRAVAAARSLPLAVGDFVLAIGGGSAIDLGKAVAALATQAGDAGVADYLEGVGCGLKLLTPPLAVLAMPTTAGTGSEATKNAVISSYDPPFKKSLRDDAMVPRVVLVDPELSVTTPRAVTVHCGLDAITQLIESFISRRAQPIPRALALDGLRQAITALPEAVSDPDSRTAREAMTHAALLSGIALANSGLGMAHGVAAALGVVARVPHGLACAVMLPAALAANRSVCQADFAELNGAIDPARHANQAAAADAFVARIEGFCRELGVPARLSEIGVCGDQLDELVRGSRGNSMDGNPRVISDAELRERLEAML